MKLLPLPLLQVLLIETSKQMENQGCDCTIPEH